MPELPEVETIRRDLNALIAGQEIAAVEIFSVKTAQPSAAFLKKKLIGRQVAAVDRRGKLLIFKLAEKAADQNFLLIHLKMTGQLIYIDREIKSAGGHGAKKDLPAAAAGLPNKQTRAAIKFSGGGKLFFNDLRKFGYLKIASSRELESILKSSYGPEPLTPEFSLKKFQEMLTGRKIKIKALLLNQKIIAGLGNIYADETLFAAGVRPDRLAGSLTAAEIKKLWLAINRIIKQAIKYRGTTFNNYVDSRGKKGSFLSYLRVYGRQGRACYRCGREIKKMKLAGRGTHYCPICQK